MTTKLNLCSDGTKRNAEGEDQNKRLNHRGQRANQYDESVGKESETKMKVLERTFRKESNFNDQT